MMDEKKKKNFAELSARPVTRPADFKKKMRKNAMRYVWTQTGQRKNAAVATGKQDAKENKKKKQDEKRFIYDVVKKNVCARFITPKSQ